MGPRNFTCSCPSMFTGKRCELLAGRVSGLLKVHKKQPKKLRTIQDENEQSSSVSLIQSELKPEITSKINHEALEDSYKPTQATTLPHVQTTTPKLSIENDSIKFAYSAVPILDVLENTLPEDSPSNFKREIPDGKFEMDSKIIYSKSPKKYKSLKNTTSNDKRPKRLRRNRFKVKTYETLSSRKNTRSFKNFRKPGFTNIDRSEESPRGDHSQLYSVTASPIKAKNTQHEKKRRRENEEKNDRQRYLQTLATIEFKQPRIAPTVRTKSRPLKLPFTVIDRAHLSLPVFLPRVIDIRNKTAPTTEPSTFNSTIKASAHVPVATTHKPATISEENLAVSLEDAANTNHSDVNTESDEKSTNQSDSVSLKQDTGNVHHPQNSMKSKVTQENIDIPKIKSNLSEELFDKPEPVRVYNDIQEKSFDKISTVKTNQFVNDFNFLLEDKTFLAQDELADTSNENISRGPSRPMFLVAVRPIPRPVGELNPVPAFSGNPVHNPSINDKYIPATFIQESRGGKFLPQGRSVGSSRIRVQALPLNSPSYSVSGNPQRVLQIRRRIPSDTRISRRIGMLESSSEDVWTSTSLIPRPQLSNGASEHLRSPIIRKRMRPIKENEQSSSQVDRGKMLVDDSVASRSNHFNLFEEHSADIVHMGANSNVPMEVVRHAYIEIKKASVD